MRRREVVEVAEDENGTKSETMTLTLFINFSYFSERPPAIASFTMAAGGMSWKEELDKLTKFSSDNTSFVSNNTGNKNIVDLILSACSVGGPMIDLEKIEPGKKPVQLEESDSDIMINTTEESVDARAKISSGGRGRGRRPTQEDDGFISRQIAETLCTGHRSGGSSGNGASSSCS